MKAECDDTPIMHLGVHGTVIKHQVKFRVEKCQEMYM